MFIEQILLGIAGLAASVYGRYVKQQHKKNPKYEALCDFGLIATPLFNKLTLFSSVVACISSVYLGCLLAFVLKDFCLVCITTYIINAALLWLNVQKVYSNINERRF